MQSQLIQIYIVEWTYVYDTHNIEHRTEPVLKAAQTHHCFFKPWITYRLLHEILQTNLLPTQSKTTYHINRYENGENNSDVDYFKVVFHQDYPCEEHNYSRELSLRIRNYLTATVTANNFL